LTSYRKASDDEILKLLAIQQSTTNQLQDAPTNLNEK
jgi:hypothetical protein